MSSETLQSAFEETMQKLAKGCMCDDCKYWRTIANTIIRCAYIVGQSPYADGWKLSNNPDLETAHRNGKRIIL